LKRFFARVSRSRKDVAPVTGAWIETR